MKASILILGLFLVFYCALESVDGHHDPFCPQDEPGCHRSCVKDHGAGCGYCTGYQDVSCLCLESPKDCPKN
uniref:Venom toxin-like peptide n=1 Tax=Mesobuthus eupeus TaxID=34648 RepID=E4VP01_MESEU|nr:venom toxin-like peptide [Mesobuthus eupeus]